MDIRNVSNSDIFAETTLDVDTGLYYVDLDKPAGLAVGDLMWAVGVGALAVTPPVANGWTTETHTVGDSVVAVSSKVAVSDDVVDTLRFATPDSAVGPVTITWLAIKDGASTVVNTASSVTSGTVTCPTATPAADGLTFFVFAGCAEGQFGLQASPSEGAVTVSLLSRTVTGAGGSPNFPELLVATQPAVAGTGTGTSSLTVESSAGTSAHIGVTVLVQPVDPRPSKPVLISPEVGAEYATNEDIPLALTPFSTAVPGRVSAGSTFEYKETGDSFVTVAGTVDGTGVIPAGTITTPDTYLAAGLYTNDTGDSSPYSDLVTFTVVDPPATPVITAPTSGDTIDAPTGALTATAAMHDAYQWRVVADDSGDPDPSTIYAQSALIVDSGAPSATASYPVNDVTVHTQLRIRHSGHFSDWADVSNPVSWTKPDKPVITGITEIPNDAAITVDYTCAVDSLPSDATFIELLASADDFATSFVAVTKTDLGALLPVTVGTAPWHLPASGVGYSFKVRAFNAYGAFNDSDPDGSTTGTEGDLRTIIIDGGGP